LAAAALNYMKSLKAKVKIITFDNGLEFVEHEVISKGLRLMFTLFTHTLHGSEVLIKIQMV
jgi:IS30 family transposase